MGEEFEIGRNGDSPHWDDSAELIANIVSWPIPSGAEAAEELRGSLLEALAAGVEPSGLAFVALPALLHTIGTLEIKLLAANGEIAGLQASVDHLITILREIQS